MEDSTVIWVKKSSLTAPIRFKDYAVQSLVGRNKLSHCRPAITIWPHDVKVIVE